VDAKKGGESRTVRPFKIKRPCERTKNWYGSMVWEAVGSQVVKERGKRKFGFWVLLNLRREGLGLLLPQGAKNF